MNYLLDTDIVSYFLKNNPSVIKNINSKISQKSSIFLSIITHYEILSGLKFKNSEKYLNTYISFSKEIDILPITETSVEFSSEIYATLRKKGNPLDDMDILIAGIGLENKCILVTGNEDHFKRIKGLKVENWSR